MTVTEEPKVGLASEDYFERLTLAKSRLARELFPNVGSDSFAAFVSAETPDPMVNVVGVGIGQRLRNFRPTGEYCLKIYVRKKFLLERIRSEDQLSPGYEGFRVDIEESGLLTENELPNPELPDPRSSIRPIQPGCSVSPCNCQFDAQTGTLGAILTNGTDRFALSNAHVFASACQHRTIYQPGAADSPSQFEPIGVDRREYPRSPNKENIVDAAVAKLVVDASPDPLFIGGVRGTKAAAMKMWVHMYGRTSHYSDGFVQDVEFYAKVYSKQFGANLYYPNQIQVRTTTGQRFSDNGDSGALLISDDQSKQAVGLLFAGGPLFSLANPFHKVLEALNLQLIHSELRGV